MPVPGNTIFLEGEPDWSRGRKEFLPRPRRPIPIWVGGFREAAFRRGARIADGFIFAGDAAAASWQRVEHHLAAAGRSSAGFGRDLITNAAKSVETCVQAVETWRESGGTHASVCTMGMGFKTTSAHVDFITEVRARVAR